MGTIGRILEHAGDERRFRGRPARADWRRPVDGRAPRLGPREYIGHDVPPGRGAGEGRDPMVTPRWWSRPRWVALLGWAALSAGSGYLSWRRHGGRAFLFGGSDEE